MFKPGDKLYILDNGSWQHKKKIKILERDFVRYIDDNHIVFDGETSLTIQKWAVAPTVEDATKFAVTYLIMVNELGLSINNINIENEYKTIEKNYPDLIFKYMDKVEETI